MAQLRLARCRPLRFLVPGLLGACLCAGRERPLPEPQEPFYRVALKPFCFTVLEDNHFDTGQPHPQIQYAEGDRAYYCWAGQLLTLSVDGCRALARPTAMPEPHAWADRHQLKYRFGAWYYRTEDRILRVAPGRLAQVILKTGRAFSQFEVSPSGQVLVIGSGEAQLPPTPWPHREPLDHCKPGTGAFLTLYDPATGEPEQVMAWPSDLEPLNDRVNGLIFPQTSFWVSDRLVILTAEWGRIWVYEEATHRLVDVKTPWPRLDLAFLEAHRPQERKTASAGKQIHLMRDLFPSAIEAYPSGFDSVHLILVWRAIRPGFVKAVEAELRPSPFFGHLVKPEVRPGSAAIYRINLIDGALEALPPADADPGRLRALKDAHILRFDGEPTPIPAFIEPEAAPRP